MSSFNPSGISITKPTPKVEKPSKEKGKGTLFDGISPTRTPTQNEDKPASQEKTSKVIITRRTQVKIQFQLPTMKYQIEEAYQFRETVMIFLDKIENKKISDENFIKMASHLSRFKLTQQRKFHNNYNTDKSKNRSKSDEQAHKINTALNKLTIDNFMSIIDNLTINEKNFLNSTYLETLAKSIAKQASEQPLYSSLYSLSVTSISSVLDNPEYAEFRQTFNKTLIQEALKNVEESINEQTGFASDKAIGSASFFGYLTNREFIPIQLCFELIQKVMTIISNSNIEICRQILIPVGEKIEEKYPEEFKKIIDKLEAATKDKKIPGSIRYPLIDLLGARKDNWNTKPLMHIITSTKAAKKNNNTHNVDNKITSKKKDQQVFIEVANNRYNVLLQSDDDDEIYDDDDDNDNLDDGTEFDGNDMIRRYVIDNEISSSWNRSHIGELLFAIALRPNKEISKAMKLLQILNDDNNLATNETEEENVFKAICETVEKCSSDEITDSENYNHAIDNCGTMFARLVYFGISSVDQFGTVFPIENFRITVVLSFLCEMIKLKKIQLVKESQYWTNYQWRPEGYSNLKITNSIAELPEQNSSIIFELFPLFDCLWTLQDDVEYLASPHDDDEENFNLANEIDGFSPDVIADPAFATGALEIIFKANICFDVVLPFLDQNKLTVLLWVEKYGIREFRDTKEVVKLITNVYHSGNYNKADLIPFYEVKGDEKHQEIIQNLKKVI